MAFVGNTPWVVSNSERNTRIIQRDIAKTRKRGEESGAVFEASKTAFIHFTRYGDLLRDSDMPLCFKETRYSKPINQSLGVILDQGLRFKRASSRKQRKRQRDLSL